MEQFRSKHKQTQSEWEAEMSKKVLEFVRSELYMDLRFLDIALGTLVYRADENIRSFATDGTYLLFFHGAGVKGVSEQPEISRQGIPAQRAALYLFSSLDRWKERPGKMESCLRYCGGIHDRPDGQTEYEADLKLAETNGL